MGKTTADLLTSLHRARRTRPVLPLPRAACRASLHVGDESYGRHPELIELVPLELTTRTSAGGPLRRDAPPTAPLARRPDAEQILDGGARRGLVAIDPAPCLGDDVAFDAIDVLWQADDVVTIAERAKLLAPAIGADADRLFEWCTAFAAMAALELAESPDASADRIQTYIALAAQAPRA